MKKLVRILIVAIGLTGAAQAETPPEFARANQEFGAGNFDIAIADYEKLVQTGNWNATLFYDLGNSYYRKGDFGRAILNYDRALALEPNHPEARANLRIARDNSHALQLAPAWTDRLLRFATVQHYTIAACIAFWAGLFGLAAFFVSRRSPFRMVLSLLALAVCGGLAYSIYVIENGNTGRSLAVVTSPNITARLATADSAAAVLALPVGSEVRILSQRGEWVYAALPNDLRGWMPATGIEQVRL